MGPGGRFKGGGEDEHKHSEREGETKLEVKKKGAISEI